MDSLDILTKKKVAVERQIKRICEGNEKGDLPFLQAALEEIDLKILEKQTDTIS